MGTCTSGYGSTLISLPKPGQENDDSNPPRVAPRNLFDLAAGDDNLFHGERYKWSLQLTAIHVTNKLALYNFLSTFSLTHYATPRALMAELGFFLKGPRDQPPQSSARAPLNAIYNAQQCLPGLGTLFVRCA